MSETQVVGTIEREAEHAERRTAARQRVARIGAGARPIVSRIQVQIYDPLKRTYMGWPDASVSLRSATLADAEAFLDALHACVQEIGRVGSAEVLGKLGVFVERSGAA